MTPALGKRKRVTRTEIEQASRSLSPSPSPSPASEEPGGEEEEEDIQDIFRRAFEAKFKPLDVEPKRPRIEGKEKDEKTYEDSDWSGISSSEEEEDNDVQVIEYSDTRPSSEKASKAELRAFMSSKPPSVPLSENPISTKPDLTETAHLKNDLALQRLLRDSHLLSSTYTASSGLSTPTLSATGSARHKSTDLHLLSLGAKSSIHTQKNMPMTHRKGMAAKSKQREEKRRAEAKENGVILEREVRKRKFVKERERGVGGPAVGKYRGGTLTLSKKDVAAITGGDGRGKGKRKMGRR